MDALVGHTGFVGSNVLKQRKFDELFNSSNIEKIAGKNYDCLVCAGAPAEKWKANQEPDKDQLNIKRLIGCLSNVEVKNFILISTVDVYPKPSKVDEDSVIHVEKLHAYGQNRHLLEQFVRNNMKKFHIVRLPGLFGCGLKKNFIYDLLHNNALDYTHNKSVFQFYDLDDLWKDIKIQMKNKLSLVNFATEPLSARELAKECFNIDFDNITPRAPARYDMWSKYSHYYSGRDKYLYTKKQIIRKLKKFIKENA